MMGMVPPSPYCTTFGLPPGGVPGGAVATAYAVESSTGASAIAGLLLCADSSPPVVNSAYSSCATQ
jgi:hypothetical protein